MRPARTVFGVWVCLMLVACAPSTDYSDLQEFMAQVDARPPPRTEPLPPIETVAPFSYLASTQRSPFEPPVVLKRVDRQSGPKVTPDLNRVKQFLEQYPIGQLSMVGTLAQGAEIYGLIQDADGGVHRVQSGDFMGTDHGQIERISDIRINLIEIVPDGIGGWVERERAVSLTSGV